jgi:hypothetical protein
VRRPDGEAMDGAKRQEGEGDSDADDQRGGLAEEAPVTGREPAPRAHAHDTALRFALT